MTAVAMKERKEPEFVQFKGVGDRWEGKLLTIEKLKMDGGVVKRYVLELGNGERIAFLGTAKIDALLSADDIDHLVFVAYTGDSKTVIRDGKAMKEYRIAVSERPVRRFQGKFVEITLSTTGLEITDEDLPNI